MKKETWFCDRCDSQMDLGPPEEISRNGVVLRNDNEGRDLCKSCMIDIINGFALVLDAEDKP